MQRTGFLVLIIVMACLFAETARAQSPTTGAAKRNVILIVSDDLTNTLGCYGNTVVKTPQIDRLARQGVVFRHNYCQLAICNPSRASMMSGLTPEACGVLRQGQSYQPGPSDPPFLHRLYQANGWETIHVGKIFHGTHTPAMLKANPTRANLSTDDPGGWNLAIDKEPVTLSRKQREADDHANGERRRWRAITSTGDNFSDAVTTREATRQLERLAADRKPFFMALGYHKPHLPWVVPQKYFDLYKLEDMVLPKEPPGHAEAIPPYARNNSTNNPPRDEKEFRESIRAYYACVSCLDDQVGCILDAMDRLKLWDTTTVVLVGDNGFHLGEHGLWGKRTLFEQSAAVPLIIAGAGVDKPGTICRRTVENLDIYPTVAELCGLPRHGRLMGKSLVPLLKDPGVAWDKPAYTVVEDDPLMGRSIRTERYRYTEWNDGKTGVELYDHESDPGEYHNIAADPKMADTVKTLKAQLQSRKAPIRFLKTARGEKIRTLKQVAYAVATGVAVIGIAVAWWWRRRKATMPPRP